MQRVHAAAATMTETQVGAVRAAAAFWATPITCAFAFGCEPDASALFSCDAAGGKKYIELCASNPPNGPDGYLEYRFGAPGREGSGESVELRYPPVREASLQRFWGATYTNKGVYTQSVRFETGQSSYAVFTEAQGTQTTTAGVRVQDLRTGKVVTVSCSERPRFYIHELKGALACDPRTPIGRACIR